MTHSIPGTKPLVGFEISHYHTLDSTQLEMQRRFSVGDLRHGMVVIADQQTSGIGKIGRNWQSPFGNLYISFALKPPTHAVGQLCLVSAIAMGNALLALSPELPLRFKWVNDLLLDGKKCGGILCQLFDEWVIIGVGVNIAVAPEVAEYPTASLADYTDCPPSPILLAHTFLTTYQHAYNDWLLHGFAPVRQGWLNFAQPIGAPIKVTYGISKLCGSFQGIDDDGSLLLGLADGTLKTISFGEVLLG